MNSQLTQLQALLKKRFPRAHAAIIKPVAGLHPALEMLRPAPGTITEIVGQTPACGSSVLLAGFLDQALRLRHPTALVDGRDSFDPGTLPPGLLPGLLWVRCRRLMEALHSTDALIRDGNLPFVVLDMQLLPQKELQQTPGSTWHRLRLLAAQKHISVLAFTPCQSISSAHCRLKLRQRYSLEQLQLALTEALNGLHADDGRLTPPSGSSLALP